MDVVTNNKNDWLKTQKNADEEMGLGVMEEVYLKTS